MLGQPLEALLNIEGNLPAWCAHQIEGEIDLPELAAQLPRLCCQACVYRFLDGSLSRAELGMIVMIGMKLCQMVFACGMMVT